MNNNKESNFDFKDLVDQGGDVNDLLDQDNLSDDPLANEVVNNDDDTDINLLDVGEVKIRCVGFASNHGHKESNVTLAMNRARFLRAYLIKVLGFNPEWISAPEIINSDVATNGKGVSSLEGKLGRHAAVYIEVSYKDKQPTLNRTDNKNITVSCNTFTV